MNLTRDRAKEGMQVQHKLSGAQMMVCAVHQSQVRNTRKEVTCAYVDKLGVHHHDDFYFCEFTVTGT